MQQISIQKTQEHLTRVEGMHKNRPSDRMKRNCALAQLRLDWLKWSRSVQAAGQRNDSWSCCNTHKQLYAEWRKLAIRAQNLYIPSDASVQFLTPVWWKTVQYPTDEDFQVVD